MTTLHFSTVINAPIAKVWNVMLQDKTYREWAEAFGSKDSHYVGSWEKGSKIQFLAPDEHGKMGGMSSMIVDNKLHEFISIKHQGLVMGGVEDITSDEAKRWVGLENYTFKDADGNTELFIDLDTPDDFAEYMSASWPVALQKLKEIAERK